jgi:hypothetical protein
VEIKVHTAIPGELQIPVGLVAIAREQPVRDTVRELLETAIRGAYEQLSPEQRRLPDPPEREVVPA